MKALVLLVLVVFCAAILLYLRWSDRVVASDMSPVGRAALWTATFFLAFGPIALSMLKALRHYYGYDSSPLSILLYLLTAVAGAVLAFWIARWVVDVADD